MRATVEAHGLLSAAELEGRRGTVSQLTLPMTPPAQPPEWLVDLWMNGEEYRQLATFLASLEPHEVRALLRFLKANSHAYRPPMPPSSETPQ